MEKFLDYFVPESYDLELDIQATKQSIHGHVAIAGVAKQSRVKFHAVNLSQVKLLVDGEAHAFEQDDETITVSKLTPGKHVFSFDYRAKINTTMEGVYSSKYPHEGV